MAGKNIVELKDLSLEEAETKSILEKNGETVYYMPIEIMNRDQLETLGITREQCRPWRSGAEWKTVHMTPCDKEVYTLLSRDLWTSQIREFRNKRCMVPGKQKPLIRCHDKNKCDECPYGISPWNRQPNLVSLDELMDIGLEPGKTDPVDQMVFQRMELQEIKEMMDEKDKRLFQIFVMLNLLDYKKTDIALKFQISVKHVRQLVEEMNDIVQQFRETLQ